jgi:hypothetical protein
MRLALPLLALALGLPAAGQAPGRVQIIHNSPDPALATVDVYLNEVRTGALDDVAFRTATPYLEVEAGRVVSVVVAADTSTGLNGALAVGAFVSESGVDHQVIVDGLRRPYEFGLGTDASLRRLKVRVLRRGPGQIRIEDGGARIEMAFYHGSPDIPLFDYDIYSWTGAGVFGLGASYGSAVTASFPGSDVHYRFRISGQPETDLDHDRLGVHTGQSALLMLSGFFDSASTPERPALGYFVVREDGTVESVWGDAYSTPAEPHPFPTTALSVTVAPNPASDRAVVTVPQLLVGALVEVFDTLGRRVLSERSTGASLTVRTGQWPTGLYTVRLTNGRGAVASGRFTVVR